MKVTKLELQQSLNRVNNDLVAALTALSEARGDYEASQFIRSDLEADVKERDDTIRKLNTENAFLRARLEEADHRARKLIRAHNIARSTDVSERRKAMEAAKAKAMATGTNVVVGG